MVVTPELRATGKRAWPRDKAVRAPDHNTAEWSLWLGRPLLGQWVADVRGVLDALAKKECGLPKDVAVVGIGPAGVVALCAAALDERITRVATVGTLASYVIESPYEGQRLGIMAPGILRDAGDIPHLAALIAPRSLIMAGTANEPFGFTRRVYSLLKADGALTLLPPSTARDVAKHLQ